MNTRQHDMLRTLAAGPKLLRYFTEVKLADATCAPSIIAKNMRSLIDSGFVESDTDIEIRYGAWQHITCTITRAGERYLASTASTGVITPSRTFCNGAATGTYRTPQVFVRAGADDHFQYRSLKA